MSSSARSYTAFAALTTLLVSCGLVLTPACQAGAPKAEKTAATEVAKTATVPKHHAAPRLARKIMVPPPPPEIPLIADPSERQLSTLGVPLDYLSKPDLEQMRDRLQQSKERLTKEKEEHDAAYKEQKDRVERFEDLFKEGVISRKELETAHRQLEQYENNAGDQSQRLADVDVDLARVNKQLDILEKKIARRSEKKSVKKDTGNKSASTHGGAKAELAKSGMTAAPGSAKLTDAKIGKVTKDSGAAGSGAYKQAPKGSAPEVKSAAVH